MVLKAAESLTAEEQNVVIIQNRECCLQHVTRWFRCCDLHNRLTESDCRGGLLEDGREVCEELLFQGFWTEMEG